MPENTTEVVIPVQSEATVMDYFPYIWDASWKQLPVEQQLKLRESFKKFVDGVSRLRAKFDETVWAGHTDGSVDPRVESIRAQRTGDPGGRKATVKTPEELLFGK